MKSLFFIFTCICKVSFCRHRAHGWQVHYRCMQALIFLYKRRTVASTTATYIQQMGHAVKRVACRGTHCRWQRMRVESRRQFFSTFYAEFSRLPLLCSSNDFLFQYCILKHLVTITCTIFGQQHISPVIIRRLSCQKCARFFCALKACLRTLPRLQQKALCIQTLHQSSDAVVVFDLKMVRNLINGQAILPLIPMALDNIK
mmetsp:Transcript_1131/g.1982  ORF Transcript_1131/g.1982 Transcript_1131/m.1982 type:complete len:201 (+) Transcript_1131:470-1072(+)